MGNPNPQHNPTDGLGVAAKINLSGGTGASAIVAVVPSREYQITLSLSSQGTFTNSAALTAAIKDIGGNAYTPVGNATSKSYSTAVATVANSGGNGLTVTVTAVAKGEAQIDVFFPTYDTTTGTDKIYVTLRVVVIA